MSTKEMLFVIAAVMLTVIVQVNSLPVKNVLKKISSKKHNVPLHSRQLYQVLMPGSPSYTKAFSKLEKYWEKENVKIVSKLPSIKYARTKNIFKVNSYFNINKGIKQFCQVRIFVNDLKDPVKMLCGPPKPL
jgi:hypothetical protein